MKIERTKKANKIIDFYINNFSYIKPLKILVDATFTLAALQHKVSIQEQIQKYLQCDIKIVTTQCTILESENLGPQFRGATNILKSFRVEKCNHNNCAETGEKCITSMIQSSNFVVATQDRLLQKRIRNTPGKALIYLHNKTPVLDPPSRASKKKVNKNYSDIIGVSSQEKTVLQKLKRGQSSDIPVKEKPFKPRKHKKGPNPLSCKKKKMKHNKKM